MRCREMLSPTCPVTALSSPYHRELLFRVADKAVTLGSSDGDTLLDAAEDMSMRFSR